jgi:hypothetical protein
MNRFTDQMLSKLSFIPGILLRGCTRSLGSDAIMMIYEQLMNIASMCGDTLLGARVAYSGLYEDTWKDFQG